MTEPNIKIDGLAPLIKKLGFIGAAKFLQPVFKAAALTIKGKVAVYPPNSDANLPGPYPKHWYQRGYGPRWARRSGGMGGARTSQAFGRRWTVQSLGFMATVGNSATYAPYVQGRGKQAGFHARRGWRTLESVMEAEIPTIEAQVQAAVDKELAG